LQIKHSLFDFQSPGLQTLTSFPVVLSRGSHPFPSRTRKLSLLEPMVLRWKRRGRVGSRRIKSYNEARLGYIPWRASFVWESASEGQAMIGWRFKNIPNHVVIRCRECGGTAVMNDPRKFEWFWFTYGTAGVGATSEGSCRASSCWLKTGRS
jgi:hypothetical protein